jgi:hypothetical protein
MSYIGLNFLPIYNIEFLDVYDNVSVGFPVCVRVHVHVRANGHVRVSVHFRFPVHA